MSRGDADGVYVALAEAANWLSSLSERYESINADPDVTALVFARNRTHHHSASAAFFDEKSAAWLWRSPGQFPVPAREQWRDEKREPFYRKRLAGHPMLDVFDRLNPTPRGPK